MLRLFLALSLSAWAAEPPPAPPAPPPTGVPVAELVPIEITVSGAYLPARVGAKANTPILLVFTRTTWDGCTREVVFPTLDLRVELPTNQPTKVELPPLAPGEYPFHCGMKMIHGTLEVR